MEGGFSSSSLPPPSRLSAIAVFTVAVIVPIVVLSGQELQGFACLALKYNLFVISDEVSAERNTCKCRSLVCIARLYIGSFTRSFGIVGNHFRAWDLTPALVCAHNGCFIGPRCGLFYENVFCLLGRAFASTLVSTNTSSLCSSRRMSRQNERLAISWPHLSGGQKFQVQRIKQPPRSETFRFFSCVCRSRKQ